MFKHTAYLFSELTHGIAGGEVIFSRFAGDVFPVGNAGAKGDVFIGHA